MLLYVEKQLVIAWNIFYLASVITVLEVELIVFIPHQGI